MIHCSNPLLSTAMGSCPRSTVPGQLSTVKRTSPVPNSKYLRVELSSQP
ncbi:hypothetical protein [Microcoleus sp. CAWBG58]|nr:hypothetical protein [Microcoleus sp. CAWBG58]